MILVRASGVQGVGRPRCSLHIHTYTEPANMVGDHKLGELHYICVYTVELLLKDTPELRTPP